jgi:spermidine synthase
VAALFTEEFMKAAKSRLADGGVYCQWLPNYILKEGDVEMMYKTMRQVFDRVDVWSINFPEDSDAEMLLIGHKDAAGLAMGEVKQRVDGVLSSLANGNDLIAAQAITPYPGMAKLEAAVKDPKVPLNTDDHSTLEYRVFWNFVNESLSGGVD